MLNILSIIASTILIFLIIGAVLVILNDNQDSGRKVAWILVIGILPVLGLLLYLALEGVFQRLELIGKGGLGNEKFLGRGGQGA